MLYLRARSLTWKVKWEICSTTLVAVSTELSLEFFCGHLPDRLRISMIVFCYLFVVMDSFCPWCEFLFDVSILVLTLEFVCSNLRLSGQEARRSLGSMLGGCKARQPIPKYNLHEAIVELGGSFPKVTLWQRLWHKCHHSAFARKGTMLTLVVWKRLYG